MCLWAAWLRRLRKSAGRPHVAIVHLAHQFGAGLRGIGAHGTTDWTAALMGSVAEKVGREAPCSALTVRTPDQAVTIEE